MSKSVNEFTPEELAKLPKWASDKARSLARERDTAVECLHEWADTQTEAPISIMEYESTGETRGPTHFMRYVQGRNIRVKWQGIELDIGLRDGGNMHESGIRLQWSEIQRGNAHIALVPDSFQCAYLLHPKHLRQSHAAQS